MTVPRAASLGIGSMVGAGIFALLGQVGAVAGSAVWLAFAGGGVVALLNGYSYGRLGGRYPSAGGPVDYLTRAYGEGPFAGGLSIFYYVAAAVGMSLVARAFGSYAAALFGLSPTPYVTGGFAAVVVVALMLVNAAGSAWLGAVELGIVAAKLTVLAVFVVGGATAVSVELLHQEATVSNTPSVLAAVGFAFFAYTGFGVVTNAAAEMAHPERELLRAIMVSIAVVIVLYLAIAIVAFGSLSVGEIVREKETALAVAAEPAFGHVGFSVMAVAAMLSTASAINASLYGSTNVSYVLAKRGELPEWFDRRSWGGAPEGLYITTALVLVLATVLNLSQVAALGGLAAMLVYLAVTIGHLRLRRETGARASLLWAAIITTAGTAVVFVIRIASEEPGVLVLGAVALGVSFGSEALLRRHAGRVIRVVDRST